jgi:hypothetical protein
MRRQHILARNARQESPSNCIFFDTETNSELQPDGSQKLTLKFGWACYTHKIRHGKWSAGEWYRFEDASDFWSWVTMKLRPRSKLYIFAHNLIFDMTIVHGFTILPSRQWLLTKAIVDDPPTILTYRHGTTAVCLLDTFNWFHSSLAELGQGIGIPKLEMPSTDAPQGDWDAYTHRDVEIIKSAMLLYLDFIKVNDLGNFQMTQASQSFTAYRHRFMHHEILIDSNEKALDLARSAYMGGRTEAFYIGEKTGDFYLMDVNSMYPFVMAINDYPTVLRSVYSRVNLADLPGMLRSSLVVGDVTVNTTEPCYPLQSKLGLLFPVGEFRTHLATPELKLALDSQCIQQIHRLALYEHAPLFEQYVNTLYKLRQGYKVEGNHAFNYLCKLMLNSLYGKFGQRGRIFSDDSHTDSQDVKSWEEWDADTHIFVKYRQFGGLVQTYKNEGESFNSSPAIAAHVTAYARMWLWQLICQAAREHVFYCDTDSLVVDKVGYDALAPFYLGNDLGELKLERQFSHLVIHGCKDYEFGDIKKIKGVRKNATQLSANSYQQSGFIKFRGMVRAGNLDSMVVSPMVKTLKRDYQKGSVLSTGVVAPYEFPQDELVLMPARYQPRGIAFGKHDDSNKEYLAAKRKDMRENLNRGKTMMELSG